MTPLQAFGAKVEQSHFTAEFRHLRNLEDALALVETRERIKKQVSVLDAADRRCEDVTEKALNLLFKAERSKVYLEDINMMGSPLGEAEPSESNESELENEEAMIYNEMHQDADEVTSGYSTISSSKEEEYLSCHLANQNAAAMSASKVAKDNAQNIPGLISSHGTRKDENHSTGKESIRANARSRQNNQDGSTKKALNDELNDAALANILETERFKNIKVHKNQLTIVASPPEHIEMFRL